MGVFSYNKAQLQQEYASDPSNFAYGQQEVWSKLSNIQKASSLFQRYARGAKDIAKGAGQAALETATAFSDVAERTSIIEPIRNAASGIGKATDREEGMSFYEAYKQGVTESRARPLRLEKLTKEQLLSSDGSVNWDFARKFVGRAMEAPTYLYAAGLGTTKEMMKKKLLERVLSRSVKSLPEAGVNTALQQFEEGTTENVGRNLLVNALVMSGISNVVGEVKLPKQIVNDTISNIEKKTGKLSLGQKTDIKDSLKQGIKPKEILSNIQKIQNNEITPQEVAKVLNTKLLEAPNPNEATAGSGFTVKETASAEEITRAKAFSKYNKELAKYNKNPNEGQLQKVLDARKKKNILLSKETPTVAVKKTAPTKEVKVKPKPITKVTKPKSKPLAKEGEYSGTFSEAGTKNQYYLKNPYRKNLDIIKNKLKDNKQLTQSDRLTIKNGNIWELEQVLKDKPAYLNDGLSKKFLKDFAKKHNLVFKDNIVAKNEKALNRVIDSFKNKKDKGRSLGLALGYEDIGVKTKPKVKPKPTKELKVSKAAKDINKKLAKEGLDDIPEEELAKYSSWEKNDQLKKVSKLLEDVDSSNKMALSEMPIPNDVKKQILFNSVKRRAFKDGNIELQRKLALSPILSERSAHASELGSAAILNEVDDAVTGISEVFNVRKKIVEKRLKTGNFEKTQGKIRGDIEKTMKKTKIPKETWNSFIDTIKCKT